MFLDGQTGRVATFDLETGALVSTKQTPIGSTVQAGIL
jgi:hypothetical protein